jgi:hypothetical protein
MAAVQAHERDSLDVSADRKAMLMTSRRSFIAASQLFIGAFGLGLAGRSASAQALLPALSKKRVSAVS